MVYIGLSTNSLQKIVGKVRDDFVRQENYFREHWNSEGLEVFMHLLRQNHYFVARNQLEHELHQGVNFGVSIDMIIESMKEYGSARRMERMIKEFKTYSRQTSLPSD